MPRANRILIYDTDLIVTTVLAEYFLGSCPEWIKAASHERQGDLYLLTDRDTPWVADPHQREGPEVRDLLHRRFCRELASRKIPFTLVSGSVEQRMETAIQALEKIGI